MVRFFIVAASVLSLLSFARAATIDVRQCRYVCPAKSGYDVTNDPSPTANDITICRYFGTHGDMDECQYSTVS